MKKDVRFIVIEGDDGAGKSTAIDEYLKPALKNRKIAYTYEPGGGGGIDMRKFFFRKRTRKYHWKTQLLLVSAPRAENIENVILPNLEKGIHIISDRYDASTFAFQLPDLDLLNISYFESINGNVTYPARPTLYIYLRLSPEDAVKRLASGSKKLNSLDAAKMEDKHRIHKAYDYFFNNVMRMKNVVYVDATLPKEVVGKLVVEIVKAHLAGKDFNENYIPPVNPDKFFGDGPSFEDGV